MMSPGYLNESKSQNTHKEHSKIKSLAYTGWLYSNFKHILFHVYRLIAGNCGDLLLWF